MQWLFESFRQHPELALFLVLALGYGLGSLRLGTFKLGPVLGVLIAGIVVGQVEIPVSESLKNVFFMLFLFAIGYRTGPQFFHSLPQQLTEATNLTNVAAAIVVGALIGLPSLVFGGVEITLTVFVGVLLGGLMLGWLSSFKPQFGGIPEPALWLLDALGLAGFLALVGMQAGPSFVRGLQDSGVALVVSAAVVVTIPHVVGILVGYYLLHMHPGIVLGACAGAGTSAPALGALLETARSRIPALSYGVAYALGNVILAFGGSLIVRFIGSG